MDQIQELEREVELLKQLLELKEKLKALENDEQIRYVPCPVYPYPVYPYPAYPDTTKPDYPLYPIITYCSTDSNNKFIN